MTMARAATRPPWQMSRTFSLTRSQARSLLSIPRSNSARSRALRNSWSLTRIAQISFSLNGAFWPNQLALVPRFRVGATNFIHCELLKGQRELDSALTAMGSLVGIDPLRNLAPTEIEEMRMARQQTARNEFRAKRKK